MPAGRKPLGISDQVNRLEASPLAKQRLEVILNNLAGRMSVEESCAAMDVGQSWFFEYRQRSLQGFADAMELDSPGRKPSLPSPESERIAELEQQVKRLQLQLSATRLKLELAQERFAQPSLPPPRAKKKPYGDRSFAAGPRGPRLGPCRER
jgi:hypothetical protein